MSDDYDDNPYMPAAPTGGDANRAAFITIGGITLNVGTFAMDVVLANEDWEGLASAYNLTARRIQTLVKDHPQIRDEIESITSHAKTLGAGWRTKLRARGALDCAIENMSRIAAGTAPGATPGDAVKAFLALKGVCGEEPVTEKASQTFNIMNIERMPDAQIRQLLGSSRIQDAEVIEENGTA